MLWNVVLCVIRAYICVWQASKRVPWARNNAIRIDGRVRKNNARQPTYIYTVMTEKKTIKGSNHY